MFPSKMEMALVNKKDELLGCECALVIQWRVARSARHDSRGRELGCVCLSLCDGILPISLWP